MRADEIPTPETITKEFLTERLRAAGHAGVEVTGFSSEQIGTGQIGLCLRYRLQIKGGSASTPTQLVGKFPSRDPKSRMAGVFLRNFLKEVSFYEQLQSRVSIRTPRCYYAAIAGAGPSFMLLLEDLSPASQGDQLAGCTPEIASAAVEQLVGLHAPSWCDHSLCALEWLDPPTPERLRLGRAVYRNNARGVLKRYGDALEADEAELIARIGDSTSTPFELLGDVFSLIHVDYRLDNLLLQEQHDPPTVCAVDWQSLMLGNPLSDVAYFIGAGLLREQRQKHEQGIVRCYHESLLRSGVSNYSWERCWDDYRKGTFAGLIVTVVASMMVEQTERGDQMFTAMAQRHARHVLDLEADAFLSLEEHSDRARNTNAKEVRRNA